MLKSRLAVLILVSFLFCFCKSSKDKSAKTNFSANESFSKEEGTQENLTDSVAYADTLSGKNAHYKPVLTRPFQLIHTKIDLKPNWTTETMSGSATLTIKPWFYSQDSLILDAKGFDIKQVKLNNTEVKFSYNQKRIRIDERLEKGKQYDVWIQYSATPKNVTHLGNAANAPENGLYFINAQKQSPNKPQQIWTQGQTSNNSCWFPTFDQPNIRTSQEVSITVEDRFKTLSNGRLLSSNKNNDGTRTDIWRQDTPHPPYLAMLAIGEFEKITDKWRDKEVAYYVEKAYKNDGKAIFGHTPEMIDYFSRLFKYDYPWDKYSQVVVRDYISGAMENTSASVFMEGLQMEKRCLIDDNWDGIIAHELVHQWFGDLLTCEGWGSLSLNEAFANYGEYLWADYKYGRDEADVLRADELESYLREAELKRRPIIRDYYENDDDMFDSHSYSKGFLVLHYLRHIIGDEAFFEGIALYLKQNAHTSVEVAQLRMAFEQVTGLDLALFFKQWLQTAGHPELEVTHSYLNGRVYLSIKQTQIAALSTVFHIPFEVEVWQNEKVTTYKSTLTEAEQTFSWPATAAPSAVILDPQGTIPARINHLKPEKELFFQLKIAKTFAAKAEAMKQLVNFVEKKEVQLAFLDLTYDKCWQIRQMACGAYGVPADNAVLERIKTLFEADPHSNVRMMALDMLVAQNVVTDAQIQKALNDSSYYVMSSAIYALAMTKGPDALPIIEKYENIDEKHIVAIIANFYSQIRIPNKLDWFTSKLNKVSGSELSYLLQPFATYLMGSENAVSDKGLDYLVQLGKADNYFQIRKDVIQAMSVIESFNPRAASMILELKTYEKDKRVLDWINYLGY